MNSRAKSLHLTHILLLAVAVVFTSNYTLAQNIQDDFEGNGTINSWFGDACQINTSFANPLAQGINTSATVMEYVDNGGQYANARFDVANNFDLSTAHSFSFKIYVPSSGITGTHPNQVSLKLQNNTLGQPWSTQTEIIKAISLDQWQTVSFDFINDAYINLDPNSPPPAQRTDLNRVLIQVNGENNNDAVTAYIDDMLYTGNSTVVILPVFDSLVWSDEFTGTGMIDTSKWFHQTQLPNGSSWFNGEIQHYTDRTANTQQSNGTLKLIAKKETFTDQGVTKDYTSARLNSKFAFTEGRVEVRAKLPMGVGTWPAIWMLGKNINEDGGYWDAQHGTVAWPACGEIDIMEHWGDNQNYVSSAMHTPSSFGGTVNVGGQTVPTVSTQFHVYALDWTADQMVFSVDSVVHYVYNPSTKDASTWPFYADQYILLNIAIQASIDPNYTQDTMEIDYVRVYKQSKGLGQKELTTVEKVNYYPNPFAQVLNIEVPNANGQRLSFVVYTNEGRVVKTVNREVRNGRAELDSLSNLNSGLYIIRYQHQHKVYNLKVLKQ